MFRPGQLSWICLVATLLWADVRALGQLRISDIRREADGTVTVRFPAQAGTYYVLRRGTTLPELNRAVALKLGATGELELTDPATSAATGFYRLSEIDRNQAVDTDGDGIDDVYELEHPLILNPLDVGDATGDRNPAWGTAELAKRQPRPDLAPDPGLPADTRLWAALQHASGGVWGGCVYDPEMIAAKLSQRV